MFDATGLKEAVELSSSKKRDDEAVSADEVDSIRARAGAFSKQTDAFDGASTIFSGMALAESIGSETLIDESAAGCSRDRCGVDWSNSSVPLSVLESTDDV